jgi:hypothetical protein
MNVSSTVWEIVAQPSSRPISKAIRAVGDALAKKYGSSALGVLLYGSCLRAGTDHDSLVDCYVLVDDYGSVYQKAWLALFNRWLPPNVFYWEVPAEERIVRVKYAVLSLDDFERSVSSQWFHSYFWARFAQPTVLLLAATPEVERRVFHGLAKAVRTFVGNTLPRMTQAFTAEQLWHTGLMLTYGAELRSEPQGRVQTLWAHDREFYEQVTQSLLLSWPSCLQTDQGEGQFQYTVTYGTRERLLNRFGWVARKIQGKILSILRLMKAAFTFQGGADYLIWKIERHSGVKIELTPAQRRHPIWAGLTTFWRLYRKGAFR